MKIAIAADHGGFILKEHIKKQLDQSGHKILDVGCFSNQAADYPDFGLKASQMVSKGDADRAILICKSGIGMSIVSNKVKGVRGALCLDMGMAESSRRHNNANVLVLSANSTAIDLAEDIVNKWLSTEFEGGRHQKRVEKISHFENDSTSCES